VNQPLGTVSNLNLNFSGVFCPYCHKHRDNMIDEPSQFGKRINSQHFVYLNIDTKTKFLATLN